MDKLHLGIDIRDFDLERLGFSLSVLDETNKRPSSEGYLRMTLAELNTFVKVLRAANESIELSTVETSATTRLPSAAMPTPPEPMPSAPDALPSSKPRRA